MGAQPSPTTAPSNADLVGPIGLLIVGLLGLIGGLLPWISVSTAAGGFSESVQGSSILPGSTNWRPAVAAALGAFILACAAGYLFGRRSRSLLGVMTALSLILLGFGVYNIIDVYRQANDLYNQMDRAFSNLPPGVASGAPNFRDLFSIDPAPGLWMVAIAGLIGSVLTLSMWIRKPAAATPVQFYPPAPPPVGYVAPPAFQPNQPYAPPPPFDPRQPYGAPTADPTQTVRPAEPPEPS
jgi:hypothetical protein